MKLLHGLVQKAKLDAETIPYQMQKGGKGYRIWQRTIVGWRAIGEMSDRQDAEDFLMSKLTQEDR